MLYSSILLAAALVVAAPPQTRDAAAKLRKGDPAIVVDKDAEFTQRGRTVARLPVGTTLEILALRREKVQVRVKIGGAIRDGWIAATSIRAVPSKDRGKEDSERKQQSDLEKLQGTWLYVSSEWDGKPARFNHGDHLVFSRNNCSMTHLGVKVHMKFTLNESSDPKRMLLIPDPKRFLPGKNIYRLQGDTLIICEMKDRAAYPKRFTANRGDGNWLAVLKRYHPPKENAALKRLPKFGADGKPPLRYEQIYEVASTTSIAGREQKMTLRQISRVVVVVTKKLPAGGQEAQVIFESVRVAGNRAAAPMVAMYSQLHGASFKLTLSAAGEITKLDGYEAMIKQLAGDNDLQAQRLRQAVREEAIKGMLASWFGRMSPERMQAGTSWKQPTTLSAGPAGEIAGEVTATYKGRTRVAGRECARFKLSAESTYSPPSGGGALGYEIVDGKVSLKGPAGEALYDTKTGRLIKSTRKTRIHGRLRIKVNGQTATMILDHRETTQIRLLKPADLAPPPAKAKARAK
ncbi:MAG: TIGR03067 domain-containing protein [Planctomycetes bacterium]|nr:TIGR03067 domain-containing protein [Planctomycetota bacterium]